MIEERNGPTLRLFTLELDIVISHLPETIIEKENETVSDILTKSDK